MQVNSIKPVSFKAHYVNVDIGASSINGSMKIRTLDDKGNQIDYYKTTVFDEGQRRSEQKMEQSIANKVAASEYRNEGRILKADPDNEVYLTVCYPGAKVSEEGQDGFRLSNFFYDDQRQNRFHRTIRPDNIDKYLAAQGVNIVQTRHVNDMAGAGACILDKVQKEAPELLKEGEEILFLYPGGGLGSGFITVDKNDIKIKPSEMQHARRSDDSGQSLEADVGVPGFIGNFADTLGMTDAERKIIGNDARVPREFDVLDEYLPGRYTPAEHRYGSMIAINKFVDSLAEIIAMQICTNKLKSVVITGNVANGVKDVINKDEENNITPSVDEFRQDGADKFTGYMRSRVCRKLTAVGNLLLPNPNELVIKCVEIKDNTEGAQVLQKCDEVGKPAKWYNMQDK